jgi:mono/diheme cytochrome c family protein
LIPALGDGIVPPVSLSAAFFSQAVEFKTKGARSMFVAAVGMVALVADLPASGAAPGQLSYLRSCARCHGIDGRGDGPEASAFLQRPANLRHGDLPTGPEEEQLIDRLRAGRRQALELRPTALREHAGQTDALYAYLRSMPSAPWERLEAGEAVYLERCADCHGRYGDAPESVPPGVQRPVRSLGDPVFQRAHSDRELRLLCRHGKSTMPALIPRPTETQVAQVSGFVRWLSPGYRLYDWYCRPCHGTRGEGVAKTAPDSGAARFAFDDAYFRSRSPDEIQAAIWHMLRREKPRMPHFSSLSVEDLRDVLAYLRGLTASRPAPTISGAQP